MHGTHLNGHGALRSQPSAVHFVTQDYPMEDVGNESEFPDGFLPEDALRQERSLKKKAQRVLNGMCTMRFLRRRLPILAWLPSYSWSSLSHDLIAGVTVGLTTIPQGIAYAAVAGLPLQYGLYSAFMGLFVYVFLGSVKESSVGPTAVMSLMTFTYAKQGGPGYAVLLAFLAGWLELIAGLLNLGFMVEFISAPVISGFCSAAALTVASTQVKGLFGLKFKGSSFIETWQGFFTNITSCSPWDSALGCSCIVILLLMRKLTAIKNLRPFKKVAFLRNRFVDSTLWFVATSRNAVAVIGGCLAAYLLEYHGSKPFTLTGDIHPGLPPFELPPFSAIRVDGNNTLVLGFSDICSELGAAIGLIPLIAILEQVAIAKAFASGKQTDATQEMIALGVGTILGSLFGSMPITASFGRSSVQAASGVKTPLANIWAGILVLLALAFLMPSLAYIPKTILASVIITSVIFMFEYEEIMPMWKTRRVELLPFGATFLCCLFINMEYGILIGAGVHLILLAYLGNRPHPKIIRLPANQVTEERIVVKADTNLYFPGVEKFRSALNKASEVNTDGKPPCLMIDLSPVTEIDYTGLKMLKSVAAEGHKRGNQVLHFVNATPKMSKVITATLPSADIAFVPNVISDDCNEKPRSENFCNEREHSDVAETST